MNNEKNLLGYALTILVISLPVLMFFTIIFITGHGFLFNQIIPTVSGEVSWYMQVDSFVKHNGIMGNYGYNDSYAPIGGIGTRGIFPLLPYVLIGKFFGSGYSIMHISNLILYNLAIFSFIVCLKPNRRQLVVICLVQPALYLIQLYLTTDVKLFDDKYGYGLS